MSLGDFLFFIFLFPWRKEIKENNDYKLGPQYKPPIHTRGLIFSTKASRTIVRARRTNRPRVLMASYFQSQRLQYLRKIQVTVTLFCRICSNQSTSDTSVVFIRGCSSVFSTSTWFCERLITQNSPQGSDKYKNVPCSAVFHGPIYLFFFSLQNANTYLPSISWPWNAGEKNDQSAHYYWKAIFRLINRIN